MATKKKRKKRTVSSRGSCSVRCKLSGSHIPKGLTKGDEFVRQVGGKSVRFRVMAGTTPQGRRYRYALEIVGAPRTKKKATKKRTTKRRTTAGRRATTKRKRTKKRRAATSGYRPLYG